MLVTLLSAKRKRPHCPTALDREDDGMDAESEESPVAPTTKKRKLRDGEDDTASVGGGGGTRKGKRWTGIQVKMRS